jgi:Flp pilus assembly protein TadG
MQRTWGSRKQDDHGAAAVETALCLCFLILPLVFATIAYAYMFSFRQTLSQAASEGARAAVGAASTPTCSGDPSTFTPTACPAQYAAATGVSNALSTYGMTCGTKNLTCTITPTTTGCPSPHTCLSVTVTYPYRDHSLLPTVPGLGFTLPGNLTFSTVVQVS